MEIIFALISSLFASVTAVFIKIGLSGIDSNLASAIRTIVILIMSWIIVFYINSINSVNTIEALKNLNSKTIIFLILSGAASCLSWLFYFKALQIGNVSSSRNYYHCYEVIFIDMYFVFYIEDYREDNIFYICFSRI